MIEGGSLLPPFFYAKIGKIDSTYAKLTVENTKLQVG